MKLDGMTLLEGPRSRRMVLEYILACEERHVRDNGETAQALWGMVRQAADHLVPVPEARTYAFWSSATPDSPSRIYEDPASPPDPDSRITPERVAEQIRRTTLLPPDPALLLAALTASVESAAYWRHPVGQDVLANVSSVREALKKAARLIAESSDTRWWSTPADLADQWFVYWGNSSEPAPSTQRRGLSDCDFLEKLTSWRIDQKRMEEKYRRSATESPLSGSGGAWWTTPPAPAIPSTRIFPGTDMPAGVPLQEDRFGDMAHAFSYTPPPNPRIYEINEPADWVRLCDEFPLDQTYTLRREWFRVTGRDGRWIVPDWSAVAEKWEAVHLTVAGYLRTATRAVPVGAPPDGNLSPAPAETMMAGWSPDETWWFREREAGPFTGGARRWTDHGAGELAPDVGE
ncbi:hypothetical protein [Corynebacterium glyciniphilum]|uniref:hypothetical protein n=1 Tax=Corynebacterium glyciniphilum TaxID=1404244 RepID=UPI002352BB7C